jgi:hypothetical protein
MYPHHTRGPGMIRPNRSMVSPIHMAIWLSTESARERAFPCINAAARGPTVPARTPPRHRPLPAPPPHSGDHISNVTSAMPPTNQDA